ncbi:MAG: Rieske 2Fe-2S domain-containing protein [Chitinophagaceae bacterium]|nr:Rieske 2Fe-2S domain-containing protein [Chitinophagaceae bacterium]
MERRDFLNNVGQVAAIVCAGRLLASCSKSEDNPDPGGGGGGNARLTANLTSELAAVGSSKVNGNVIVVRTATGNVASSFVALSLVCTHEQCTVNYDPADNDFKCPCHGSQYEITGAVKQGPAPSALTKYTISINNNILTVT